MKARQQRLKGTLQCSVGLACFAILRLINPVQKMFLKTFIENYTYKVQKMKLDVVLLRGFWT